MLLGFHESELFFIRMMISPGKNEHIETNDKIFNVQVITRIDVYWNT